MSSRLLSQNETGATYFGDPEVCVTEVAMGLRTIASSYANESEFDKRCSSNLLACHTFGCGHRLLGSTSFSALISLSLFPVRYSLLSLSGGLYIVSLSSNPSSLTVYIIAKFNCFVKK